MGATLNRINDVSLEQQREREPDELLALLRKHVSPRGLTSAFGGRIALVDTLIHHQDIRRALCLPRDVPAERLRVALPLAFIAPPIKAMWHVRGVKVVATDVRWSGGAGPEARGAGAAILMLLIGVGTVVGAYLGGQGVSVCTLGRSLHRSRALGRRTSAHQRPGQS